MIVLTAFSDPLFDFVNDHIFGHLLALNTSQLLPEIHKCNVLRNVRVRNEFKQLQNCFIEMGLL